MNYLAHIYLSGSNPKMQLGGFIADFVKGSNWQHYPKEIRNGILLHRQIDSYFDQHKLVGELLDMLRPIFGRYNGIVLDMYFDYFLANEFKKFSKTNLLLFSLKFYITCLRNYGYLPDKVKYFIFHFIATNRLYAYRSTNGLRKSLEIMQKYKMHALNPQDCIHFLSNHTDFLNSKFELILNNVIAFSLSTTHKNE